LLRLNHSWLRLRYWLRGLRSQHAFNDPDNQDNRKSHTHDTARKCRAVPPFWHDGSPGWLGAQDLLRGSRGRPEALSTNLYSLDDLLGCLISLGGISRHHSVDQLPHRHGHRRIDLTYRRHRFRGNLHQYPER